MSTLRVLAVLQVSQKVDPVEDVDEGEEIGGMRRRGQGGETDKDKGEEKEMVEKRR